MRLPEVVNPYVGLVTELRGGKAAWRGIGTAYDGEGAGELVV